MSHGSVRRAIRLDTIEDLGDGHLRKLFTDGEPVQLGLEQELGDDDFARRDPLIEPACDG